MIQQTQEYKARHSQIITELWKNEDYRAKVIKAQRANGLRSYRT